MSPSPVFSDSDHVCAVILYSASVELVSSRASHVQCCWLVGLVLRRLMGLSLADKCHRQHIFNPTTEQTDPTHASHRDYTEGGMGTHLEFPEWPGADFASTGRLIVSASNRTYVR